MKITNMIVWSAMAFALIAVGSAAHAAPLPNGTKLLLTPGNCPGATYISGSCFGWINGTPMWIPISGGTDGGIIIGKNQKSGGQELDTGGINSTPGELTAAFDWWAGYDTFATTPLSGVLGGVGVTDASLNIFDNASCAGAACIGKTRLGTWHQAFKGVVIPFGSASACGSGATKFCIGVSNWTVNSNNTFQLDYTWASSDYSFYSNVPIQVRLVGTIIPPATTPVMEINGVWQSDELPQSIFVFGENLSSVSSPDQIIVNGTHPMGWQFLDKNKKRILWLIMPDGSMVPPFTVTITTPNGTATFPKICPQ